MMSIPDVPPWRLRWLCRLTSRVRERPGRRTSRGYRDSPPTTRRNKGARLAMSAHSDLIEQLSDVGRTAVAQGLVLASGGNLSARAPSSNEFVVTGTGTYLDRLARDDFSLVGLDGEVRG